MTFINWWEYPTVPGLSLYRLVSAVRLLLYTSRFVFYTGRLVFYPDRLVLYVSWLVLCVGFCTGWLV